ncbi:hypothetical protein QQ045_021468 [Rhodiola kirilowii]
MICDAALKQKLFLAEDMSRKMLIDGEKEKGDGQEAHYDYDLFVIGAGSGGVRAARFSANHGAKVGICELPFHPISSEVIGGVGGTCVIRGCVPKKILVYGASFGGELEDARSYGWELNNQINFNWKTLLQKKVKLFEGEGRVVGPNDVEVIQIQLDGTKLSFSAKHILIATGSRAQFPNIPGKEGRAEDQIQVRGIALGSRPGSRSEVRGVCSDSRAEVRSDGRPDRRSDGAWYATG